MKVILQRVTQGSVTINNDEKRHIGKGLVLLLGISPLDSKKEAEYLSDKTVNLRIFEDEEGKMNKSLLDIGGEILIISQFTLYANCKKGKRPSFTEAAKPNLAIPLYDYFVEEIKKYGVTTRTGEFGADMLVSIDNDGPVTIILDTEEIMPVSKV